MRNNVKRYLTAAVSLPVLIFIIQYASPWVFHIVISGALLLALWEWNALIERITGIHIPWILCQVLCLILFTSVFLYARSGNALIVYFAFVVAVIGICLYWLLSGQTDMRIAVIGLSAMILSVSIIGICGGSLMMIRESDGMMKGSSLLFLLLAIVWLGDAGAMHIGRSFGKHKLSPVISPNKTLEGFLGAVVFGFIGGATVYALLDFPFSFWNLCYIAPILVTMAHVGDLTTSIFKRAAKIKDSGKLLPGHGGFLDRLDNLLFSAPFFYCIMEILRFRKG